MRDIKLEDTFYHFFTTRQFSDGVPTTLAGSPVLSVLEENNITPITAGVSVQVDRASVAGLNQATIVATAANGYEAGKSYSIYISTGTVGGTSVVGEVVGEFTVQAAPVNWDRVTSPTTAVDLSATDIQLADTVTTLTGHTAQTGDSFARIGATGSGLTSLAQASVATEARLAELDAANLPTDIADIPTVAEFNARTLLAASYFDPAVDTVANVTTVATLTGHTAQTGDSFARIGATGSGLTSLAQASVVTEARLSELDEATVGKMANQVDEIRTDTGEIGTAGAGLTNINLPNQTMDIVGNITGNLSGSVGSVTGAVGSVTGAVGSVTGAVGSVTAGVTLAAGATSAQLVDDVWDELRSGHLVAGSFGESSQVARSGTCQAGSGAGTLKLDASASATDDFYNGMIAFLISGTGAIQSRLITDYTGSTVLANVEPDWAVTPDGTTVFVLMPSPPAPDVSVPDVNVTQWLGTAAATPTVAGVPEVDVTHLDGDATAAQRLEAMMDGGLICQVNDASATTTAFAADGFTEATDDHFNGRLITFISGALTGQQTDITDYDAAGHVQGNQAFVVTALTEAPANNDFFVIH